MEEGRGKGEAQKSQFDDRNSHCSVHECMAEEAVWEFLLVLQEGRTIACFFTHHIHMMTHALHNSHSIFRVRQAKQHTHCLYVQKPVVDSIRELGHCFAGLDHLQTGKHPLA